MSKRSFKIIIGCTIGIILILTCYIFYVQGNKATSTSDAIVNIPDDLKKLADIQNEKKMTSQIFDCIAKQPTLKVTERGMKTYDNESAKKFTPPNSEVSEVLMTNFGIPCISIDYDVDNIRVIVDYFKDGKVSKTVYDRESGYIVSNFNNEECKYYNSNDVTETERWPENIKKLID
ncbi:MAG: hypothetical protein PWP48_1419 [Clostridiales bacterium]|jgi:hypothetical protein|nr:hypothetical protein [Clostridiales bacterium]MDK2992186.1 hypothetical protein [Clostridiales bacterium]